jgi:UDP-N-acetylglucosamine/UDP-N-acetylgalactosamine diphosphorylase
MNLSQRTLKNWQIVYVKFLQSLNRENFRTTSFANFSISFDTIWNGLLYSLVLPFFLFGAHGEDFGSLNYFWQHEPQVFYFWSSLAKDQQIALENQLHQINLEVLEEQKRLIQEESLVSTLTAFESFEDFAVAGDLDNQMRGQQMIEQGRLGCLLLAGGQGTRLQYSGVKGTYPISVIKNKSLFQLCAEKVRAASQKAGRPLSLAVMTSPDNDVETRSFFRQHDFFGLDPSQISFFVQKTLPLLDANGKLFLQSPWQIATGADGNGHSLLCFAESGILNQWIQQGIEYIHVILVDNPLADPFDAELLGFHQQQGSEMTLKCTEKIVPEERVGVLIKQNGHCKVIEYSEMADKEKRERRLDGRLKHCCANLSLFCFSISFIQRLIATQQSLPLHKAWKAAQYVDEKGISYFSSQPIAWKFENFIFDWLKDSQRVAALIYPREQCFAPLKNAKGADSSETVREALQQADRRVIETITGLVPPNFPFELAAEFYYPTSDLLLKWKGRVVTTPYVAP